MGLPMGLAFDNLVELTQTLSGSNTLHDTMGILYQNIAEDKDDCCGTDHKNTSTRTDYVSRTTVRVKKSNKKSSHLQSPELPLNCILVSQR